MSQYTASSLTLPSAIFVDLLVGDCTHASVVRLPSLPSNLETRHGQRPGEKELARGHEKHVDTVALRMASPVRGDALLLPPLQQPEPVDHLRGSDVDRSRKQAVKKAQICSKTFLLSKIDFLFDRI